MLPYGHTNTSFPLVTHIPRLASTQPAVHLMPPIQLEILHIQGKRYALISLSLQLLTINTGQLCSEFCGPTATNWIDVVTAKYNTSLVYTYNYADG